MFCWTLFGHCPTKVFANNSNQTVLTLSFPLTDQASPDEGGGVVGGAPGGPLGAGGGPGVQPVPPQPLFHPDDVNVQSLAGLMPHLQINP